MANAALKNMGFKRVVITLGEEGAYYFMDGEEANKAASISVTRPGAQPSIPYIKEIESLEEGKLK